MDSKDKRKRPRKGKKKKFNPNQSLDPEQILFDC